MIDWWWCAVVGGAIGLVAYAYGKAQERERCILIAVEEVGRAGDQVEAAVARCIAAQLAGETGSVEPR